MMFLSGSNIIPPLLHGHGHKESKSRLPQGRHMLADLMGIYLNVLIVVYSDGGDTVLSIRYCIIYLRCIILAYWC